MGLLPDVDLLCFPGPQPAKKHNKDVLCSSYTPQLSQTRSNPPKTFTKLEVQLKSKRDKDLAFRTQFSSQRHKWNPHLDSKIQGKPENTLFVSRLPYTATEHDLKRLLGHCGTITSVRIVADRGYAFVVYSNNTEVDNAIYATAGFIDILGRQALLDRENGRLKKNWKPAKFGGGLGGRFSLARRRADLLRQKRLQAASHTSRPPVESGRGRTLRQY